MNSKQAAELFRRAGAVVPPELAEPSAEYIKNTKRKVLDGICFRSTLEANSYTILKLWQDAGRISNLELQPRYLLQAAFKRDGKTIRSLSYTPDFRFIRDGKTVVVESKGFRTQSFIMRKKLFLEKYRDVEFLEWTRETVKEYMG